MKNAIMGGSRFLDSRVLATSSTKRGSLVVVGAAAWVATFVLGYNFDSRLVLLATLIPYFDAMRTRAIAVGSAWRGRFSCSSARTPDAVQSEWLRAVNGAFD